MRPDAQRRPQGDPEGGANGLDAGGVDVSDGSTRIRPGGVSDALLAILDRVANPDPVERIRQNVELLLDAVTDLYGLCDERDLTDEDPLEQLRWRLVFISEDLDVLTAEPGR